MIKYQGKMLIFLFILSLNSTEEHMNHYYYIFIKISNSKDFFLFFHKTFKMVSELYNSLIFVHYWVSWMSLNPLPSVNFLFNIQETAVQAFT